MKVAYIRVSTAEQNEARQIEAMQAHGIEKWFTEKVIGKDANRPKLQEMLEYVREGDTVYVRYLGADKRGKTRMSMVGIDQKTGEEIKK